MRMFPWHVIMTFVPPSRRSCSAWLRRIRCTRLTPANIATPPPPHQRNAFIFRGDCFAFLPLVFAAFISQKLRSKEASSQPTNTHEAVVRDVARRIDTQLPLNAPAQNRNRRRCCCCACKTLAPPPQLAFNAAAEQHAAAARQLPPAEPRVAARCYRMLLRVKIKS